QYLAYLTMQDKNWLTDARIYSFLMHNHWNADAPLAQGGEDIFRYAVTTHGPDWTYNLAHHFGWGFMSPLRAFVVEQQLHADWSRPVRSFVEIQPENVYLAGFKTAEDGDGAILRLFEGAGQSSAATVHFNLPGRTVAAAISCDARERNLSPLKTDRASVEVEMKPFETATVRVRFG
ncbi:MAG: glycosyl hydrolase-related protein, partial [Acidobacteriaceae bacterium]